MLDFNNLCINCMSDKGDREICPFCGHRCGGKDSSINKKRWILQNKYVVGNQISANAESISYVGYDAKSNFKVHILEFFPYDICFREEDGQTILAKESCEDKYENLKNNFLNYFRNWAKVRDVDAIASVYDIFQEYGTGYMVSEFIDGISLYDLIERNQKPLDWDAAKVLFMPLISAFNRLHRAGVLHLGITPKSLIISRNGKFYVSNFSTANLRQAGSYSNFAFERGFTAPEQYVKNCEMTQATDVYGFAATLFFALVGFAPKDASERTQDDRLLIPVKLLKNIPPFVVSAISNGLKVSVQQRTQNFEVLRDELTETSAKYLKQENIDLPRYEPNSKRKNKYSLRLILGSAIGALSVCVAAFAFLMHQNTPQSEPLMQNEPVPQDTENEDNIIVPDLVGQDYEKVKANSDTLDYNIFLSEKVFSDDVEEGKITSQTSPANASVKKGSSIVVTVSKGAKYRALPELEGLSLSQGASKLSQEGFIPVQEKAYSSEIEPGHVIGYKNHEPNDKVEVGSEITILVSKGKVR